MLDKRAKGGLSSPEFTDTALLCLVVLGEVAGVAQSGALRSTAGPEEGIRGLINTRTLVAATTVVCVVFIAGCAGTGLRHAGGAGESWYRLALPPQEGEEGDAPLEELEEEIGKAVDRGENPLIILGVIRGTGPR